MISVIIPFYNEKNNLPILLDQLKIVLSEINKDSEIILVDDGSTDGYRLSVVGYQERNRFDIRLIKHRKRFGKGRALQTGLEHAGGEIIVFMDADLQDDPRDLKYFLAKIDQGYDFINGARKNRQDNSQIKLYSKIANWFLRTVMHSPYTDINCGYKVFRKEVLGESVLYANNFRFFPLAASYRGFRVGEVAVNNRERRSGRSKFGRSKLMIGIFDTLTAYFIFRFSEAPLHFFGPIGGLLFVIGLLITGYLIIERLFFRMLLYRRPILQIGVLLIIVGIQIIMTGMIGELIVYLNKRKS